MPDSINKIFRLKTRPSGRVSKNDFIREESRLEDVAQGFARVRVEYISLDPTNRIWMTDMPQYMPPVGLGDVMRGFGVGVVTESQSPLLKSGDRVSGLLGWQTVATLPAVSLQKVPDMEPLPPSVVLGPLGMTGATAYFGLLDIGKPQAGETLVVSAAAGAVGSIVGQIGKINGLKVVGIAGGDTKCDWLTNDLGFDAAINYKSESFSQQLADACSSGIDIYFDNVGGEILDKVLPHMNLFGRIPLCGMISVYNAEQPVPGPYQFSQILMKRIRLQGFIILDYARRMPEALNAIQGWLKNDRIKYKETVVEGFDSLPDALNMLFSGDNIGKLMVRVGP